MLSDVGPELSTTDEALLSVRPAIMDIKMGTLTYAPDASAAKIKSRKRKDGATTTESHGLRVCGSIREALCCGTDSLAVDGVLLIGEHGDCKIDVYCLDFVHA